jgi:hypothetical protein
MEYVVHVCKDDRGRIQVQYYFSDREVKFSRRCLS